MTEKTEKKAIAPILKQMEVGEAQSWPRQRVSSVRNIITRVQLETDRKFTANRQGDKIVVTRTA